MPRAYGIGLLVIEIGLKKFDERVECALGALALCGEYHLFVVPDAQ
jgi:hypothetical protein